MPRNPLNETIETPDDLKESQRSDIHRRGKDYEDIEESRQTQRYSAVDESDEEELSDEDIIEIDDGVDLDRGPESPGPDA